MKEIQATSHLYHHKTHGSRGDENLVQRRGAVGGERGGGVCLSGSNNKEVLPDTSLLHLSPSVALTSFKSFKSSLTRPMASDPSF